MSEIQKKKPESSVEGCCFAILIFLSILFTLQSFFASFADLTDKHVSRHMENSARIMPQMMEMEQSLPVIEKQIEAMESRFPKDEKNEEMEQIDEYEN